MHPSTTSPAPDPLAADPLAASAKGWHRIQLAVLGFIGLCGVLQSTADDSTPIVMQWVAMALAVAALLSAGLGIQRVGAVAFPLHAGGNLPVAVEVAAGRVRAGIRLTFASVALVAVAGAMSWWPADTPPTVRITDGAGNTVCGRLEAQDGVLSLETGRGTVAILETAVASIVTVANC